MGESPENLQLMRTGIRSTLRTSVKEIHCLVKIKTAFYLHGASKMQLESTKLE